ncbi:MAG: hypothetical protein R2786_07120 [Flavobacteriaceae bacterium]
MATTSFTPVFQLNVFHEYFDSGRAEDITLIPTAETLAFMKHMGMVFRTINSESQVFIYTDSIATFQQEISVPNAINFLEFTLAIQDPNFYIYTEFPTTENVSYVYTSEYILKKPEQTIQLLPVQETKQNQFGRVRIFLKDLIAFQSQTLHYSIHFEARATCWDYYIINRSGLLLDNLRLETNADFSFEGPTHVSLQNWEETLLFTSGAVRLKLSETPKYKFNLQLLSPTLIQALPNPNPSHIQVFNENNEEHFSSPIYIYI